MMKTVGIAALLFLVATTANADWTSAIVRRAAQQAAKSAVDEAGKKTDEKSRFTVAMEKERTKLPYSDGTTRYNDLILEGESVYSVEQMEFDAETINMVRKSMGDKGKGLSEDDLKALTELTVFGKTPETYRTKVCGALKGAPDSIIRRALENGLNYVQIVTSGVDGRFLGVREYNAGNCRY